jgi:hypothetical protein
MVVSPGSYNYYFVEDFINVYFQAEESIIKKLIEKQTELEDGL